MSEERQKPLKTERRSPRELALEEELKVLKTQLRNLERTDQLTGAINTQGFKEEIEALKEMAVKGSLHQAAVIYFDIDDFKILNDTYGHSFGDEVIKIVASAIQFGGRETDTAVRFGSSSDEFALILPGANRDVAERIAQKIRIGLANPQETKLFYKGLGIPIALSTGLSAYPQTPLDELLEAADGQMLEEKQRKHVGR